HKSIEDSYTMMLIEKSQILDILDYNMIKDIHQTINSYDLICEASAQTMIFIIREFERNNCNFFRSSLLYDFNLFSGSRLCVRIFLFRNYGITRAEMCSIIDPTSILNVKRYNKLYDDTY